MQQFTSEELVGRFEDQRDIKNLMAKYSYTIVQKREDVLVSNFWSTREDISLGTNDGYYNGAEAVRGYYTAVAEHTKYVKDFYLAAFPEQMEKLTEEEQYGAGLSDTRPMSTPVVEIAGDGKTAKGIWYARGTYNDVCRQGPLSYWTLGAYACDFIRENEQWKIWHMLMIEDIKWPCGRSWAEASQKAFDDIPQFAGAVPFVPPEPNVAMKLHEAYSPQRKPMPLPEPPQPYYTFRETFSYGYSKGEAI